MMTLPIFLGACAILFGLLIFVFLYYRRRDRRLDAALLNARRLESMVDAALEAAAAKVDPWALQSELMTASGQDQPPSPVITDNSLLYAALMLEESAETFKALGVQLQRHVDSSYEITATDRIKGHFAHIAHLMTMHSVAIRQELERKPGIQLEWDSDLGVEAFDGVTDATVVTAGFALASGFPGAEGYAETQNSNLSKKNPATGVIDKTADGKWIKGCNYQQPDLGMILALRELDGARA